MLVQTTPFAATRAEQESYDQLSYDPPVDMASALFSSLQLTQTAREKTDETFAKFVAEMQKSFQSVMQRNAQLEKELFLLKTQLEKSDHVHQEQIKGLQDKFEAKIQTLRTTIEDGAKSVALFEKDLHEHVHMGGPHEKPALLTSRRTVPNTTIVAGIALIMDPTRPRREEVTYDPLPLHCQNLGKDTCVIL
jgi:hypothetical protein